MKSLSILLLFLTAFTGAMAQEETCSENTIVRLTTGMAQGEIQNGIYVYKGLPYARADRFMPPELPDSWEGVRNFTEYGHICPQAPMPAENDFISNQRIAIEGEDCQNLNIWTPGINDNGKRPVMVWLHGGGFQTGSAIEQRVYDGANLSRKGDVVVVSVNHRLNILGFLDLSAYGDEYKYSGNAGTMDMVAALKWIQNNIKAFGGDPDNVTLFGQSGGGAKVLVLMTTPAAKGLFHKGIIQSGAVEACGMTNITTEIGRRVAELTLNALGIGPGEITGLKNVPYKELEAAGNAAMAQAAKEYGTIDSWGNPGLLWTPIVDGDYLPFQPVVDSIASQAKEIPIMIGTAMTEWTTMGMLAEIDKYRTDNRNTWPQEEINRRLKERFGNRLQSVVNAFRQAYPERSIADVLYVDTMLRTPAIKTARLKADQNGGAVYNYMFAWDTPLDGGFAMSYHCSELPFVFNNTFMSKASAVGGKQAEKLADCMSAAWINFAKNGNPNHPGIPYWPAFTRENGYVMIFGNECMVKKNHDYELMKLLVPDYVF